MLLGVGLGGAVACHSSENAGRAASPAAACDGGMPDKPAVTSSKMVVMTQEEFAQQCTSMDGLMEIQPECGGSNACRGMSYDTGTETLTEHTCRGTNTCAGYTCIVCG
jgi:hypothetical protein